MTVRLDELERDVVSAVEEGLDVATKQKLARARFRDVVVRKVREVFTRVAGQEVETFPAVVGVKAAAEILGVNKPRVGVLREQGRISPLVVADNGPLYRRSDVEKLAKALEAERAERLAKREAKAE